MFDWLFGPPPSPRRTIRIVITPDGQLTGLAVVMHGAMSDDEARQLAHLCGEAKLGRAFAIFAEDDNTAYEFVTVEQLTGGHHAAYNH